VRPRPRRGDIFGVALDPTRGTEVRKTRSRPAPSATRSDPSTSPDFAPGSAAWTRRSSRPWTTPCPSPWGCR